MPAQDFNVRKDKILELIIETYISTAAPIASRTISRKLRLGLSPATIRNVMSDLEELGLVTHPHTSAGRIPTEKGYRYYIDKLMQARLLTEEEKKHIDKEFKVKVNALNEILANTSRILSSLAGEAAVVLFPLLQRSLFSHIELIRLDDYRLLAVLITESGVAENVVIDTDDDLDKTSLGRVTNFINSYIGKGSLSKIRRDIMERLLAERDSFFYILEKAKHILDTLLEVIKENRIYLDGMVHITEQPEFKDIDKLTSLLEKLEDKDFLFTLVKRGLDDEGVKVYIGSEIDSDEDEFSECSLIVSNYCIGQASCGALGIIGPTRMEYARLVSMVDYVASTLSGALSER